MLLKLEGAQPQAGLSPLQGFGPPAAWQDARSKCEAWRRDYNEQRPHSSIGDTCPIELMNGAGPYGPPGA
ncbi:integrase core domain-containing protein [Caulobacter endophyticus]|uniref:integrase core domain-containing protein n=1 Tax=Caulobacter endophyticus TaxID=2172652 RepID=UPI001304F64C